MGLLETTAASPSAPVTALAMLNSEVAAMRIDECILVYVKVTIGVNYECEIRRDLACGSI